MKRLSVILVVVFLGSGCREPAVPKSGRSGRKTEQSVSRHLTQAMDYLARSNEFDETEASRQVAFLLNRWLEGQSLDEAWQPDPQMDRLPSEIRDTPAIKDLGRTQIQLGDVPALRQAVWMRDLSKWISQRPSDPVVESWIASQRSELGTSHADRLLVAHRLFDWTVRNIQLEQLAPYPTESPVGPEAKPGQVARPASPAPMRGIPGPGYQFQPWQTLLYGRGDALQRARVFILLCRQRGIDVALLAFPGRTVPPRPREWLPAALIGGQLYLFDTRLGLPIPGPEAGGIATLKQVLAEPQLLASLAVGSQYPYDIAPDDLQSLLALLDVDPISVSRRLQLLQTQLTGEYRVVLTTSPAALAKRLQDQPGIADVAFWRVPFEAGWYQESLQERLKVDEQALAVYLLHFGVFQMRNSLVQGRHLHFRGMLESEGDEDGAVTEYLKTRVPKAQIVSLAESTEVQQRFGLVRRRGENDLSWRGRVEAARVMIAQAKEHSSYWLGLAQYELGKFAAAVEWFQRRNLDVHPEGVWAHGARYNLGRSLEALGKLEEARRQYLSNDTSPQHHGNLVRARVLAERMAEAP